MTIIQVMHSHTVGGVERHVVELSEALAERGHRVYLACPNRGWMWDALRRSPVTPYHLAMDGLLDLTSVSRLSRLAARVGADIIHSHMTRGAFYAVKAGRRMHVPVIATCHATHTWKHYAGADRVLCVSEAARDNLLHHEVPLEKTRVVYNGIKLPAAPPDPDAVAALRSSWKIPEDDLVVGMLARLIPVKGVDILLEVAARWKTERPNVHFVLAGSGDEITEAALRSAVAESRLESTVHFLGAVSNIWEVLAGFDVLAAPSRRESFSLTLLEAMASGVPVVTTNVGGTPEMVTNGITGILVEPENPPALAAGLACALDGAETRNITAAARRLVESRFTLPQMVSNIEANYIDLVR
ncbi:MAG TPA: glycosyltransferase family 4 protein [Armatimonadota bacterium]|jgi:glycosyltransferase involved in cell wall biosynthesis